MIKRIGMSLGFTLIEMAIVMVVIGLVLSGGLLAVAPVIQNTKVADTNQKLDRIEQALIVYTIRNGCLPCPAVGATASTVATAGQADGTYTTGCQNAACTIINGTAAVGVVPWRNLGLSESDITDGFGSRITYAITSGTVAPNNLQQINGMNRTPPSTYPAGTLTVNTAVAVPVTITTEAAYVLVSHGKDRNFAYLASTGTSGGDSGSTVEAVNDPVGSADGTFAQGDQVGSSPGAATYFDDIVRFRTAPMIVQLCGTNACGNPA